MIDKKQTGRCKVRARESIVKNKPILLIMLVGLVGCGERGQPAQRDSTHAGRQAVSTQDNPLPRELPGLHNVLEFSPGVVSGSVPHGEEGFESLAALGVRTIVSVDAARPEVEMAARHGIRYVHVPIQYSGIPEEKKAALAKAIRDSEGPIYVHCHHGEHRGPAATAFGLIANGLINPEEGVALMREAGTSDHYAGLYACVATASTMSSAFISTYGGDLPSIAPVETEAATMALIDHAFENVKLVQKAGWSVPDDHPDLVALEEAGAMHDHLRALADSEAIGKHPAKYHEMLSASIAVAAALEAALEAVPFDPAAADRFVELVGASCKDCHRAYRDN